MGGLYSNNPENYRLTPGGDWSLFDMEKDLFQASDIAGDHPEIVEKMSNHYDLWWDDIIEKLDDYTDK
jgi:hypothetical protein